MKKLNNLKINSKRIINNDKLMRLRGGTFYGCSCWENGENYVGYWNGDWDTIEDAEDASAEHFETIYGYSSVLCNCTVGG